MRSRGVWIALCATLAGGAPGAIAEPAGAGDASEAAIVLDAPGAWSPADPRTRQLHQFRRLHPHRDTALRLGERLVYSVRYGPVRAGEATMELRDGGRVAGDSCYHVVTTAESNDFFSTFFHVRDRVESYFTVELLQPRRFEKHLREGEYRASSVVEFDSRSHLATYDGERVVEVLPGAHDILSAFYSVRARELRVGDTFNLDCHADRKNYPLRTEVLRRERVSVPAGTFDCLVLEPALRTPGLFKQEGKLTVWLTDDERRIPVQMKSKLAIGSIAVVLTDLEAGPGGGKADESLSGGGPSQAEAFDY